MVNTRLRTELSAEGLETAERYSLTLVAPLFRDALDHVACARAAAMT